MDHDESSKNRSFFYKKRKQQSERRKRNALMRWFASLGVTAAVVVVAVSASATGATAAFTALECVGTDVLYEVVVTDQNNTLTSGSLQLIAESPLDKHAIPLQTGTTSGKLTSLLPNTEYTVSIVGSKGYGKHALEKKTIKTGKTCAGKITSLHFIQQEADDPCSTGHTSYQGEVSLFYNDSKNEIASVFAEYAFLCHGGDTAPDYSVHPVTQAEETFMLPDLPYANGTLCVRLMATLKTGETVLLDEAYASAPFILFTSVYVSPVTADSITVNIYPDPDIEAHYTATLSLDGAAVESLPLVSPEYFSSLTKQAIFAELLPNTLYVVEVSAAYVNPTTSVQEVSCIFQQEITTTAYSGGEILSATFHRVEGEYYPMFECPVHVTYEDSQNQYIAVYMEYLFQYYGEEDTDSEYMSVEVTSQDFWYSVEDISYYTGSLDVRLIAETLSGDILLDQKTFFTPFIIEGYAYTEPMLESIEMTVYPAYRVGEDTLYTASIYDETGMLLETLDVLMETIDYGNGEEEKIGHVLFKNLAEDTAYTVELSAYFYNPFTSEYETQTYYRETVQTFTQTPMP